MPDIHELREQLDLVRDHRDRLFGELRHIDAREQTEGPSDGLAERRSNLNTGIEKLDKQFDDLREQLTAEIGNSPATTHEEGWKPPEPTRTVQDNPVQIQFRDAALRALEPLDLSPEAADNIEDVLDERDPHSHGARYIAAAGDPAYESAFAKMLAFGGMASVRMTDEEAAAVRRVVDAERAMSEGTTTAGGFGVPIALDPTIVLSSNGVQNPIRSVASVITVTTNTWKGISSTDVSASWDPEATEVSDDTPTLAQPVINIQKAAAFVPFSIEVDQDYLNLRAELAAEIVDNKDVLESAAWLAGTGVPMPTGFFGGQTGSLGTAQRVLTACSALYAVADVYSEIEALPPRFTPGALFAASPTMWDKTYRLTPSGSTTEPQVMVSRSDQLLGRPRIEWSDMATVTTTGSKLLLYGDFRQFRIADRIGMTVELIPNLVGTNHRPTGQRGVFAYWRTGSTVLIPNAFRYLEAK